MYVRVFVGAGHQIINGNGKLKSVAVELFSSSDMFTANDQTLFVSAYQANQQRKTLNLS